MNGVSISIWCNSIACCFCDVVDINIKMMNKSLMRESERKMFDGAPLEWHSYKVVVGMGIGKSGKRDDMSVRQGDGCNLFRFLIQIVLMFRIESAHLRERKAMSKILLEYCLPRFWFSEWERIALKERQCHVQYFLVESSLDWIGFLLAGYHSYTTRSNHLHR